MQKSPDGILENLDNTFCIPYHAVFKNAKLRVVSNGTSKNYGAAFI